MLRYVRKTYIIIAGSNSFEMEYCSHNSVGILVACLETDVLLIIQTKTCTVSILVPDSIMHSATLSAVCSFVRLSVRHTGGSVKNDLS